MPSETDLIADIKTAEADADARTATLGRDAETEIATLFPVSLLWAHKGLLGIVGAAGLLGGLLGHAVR